MSAAVEPPGGGPELPGGLIRATTVQAIHFWAFFAEHEGGKFAIRDGP